MTATPIIINGKELAASMNAASARMAAWLGQHGIKPHFAIFLVGDYEPSKIYVTNKQKAAKAAGIGTTLHHLPASISEADLLALIAATAAKPDVHGMIVQMPLPAHITAATVLDAVPHAKDIDGLTTANLGRLQVGLPALQPCTPQGCLRLIKSMRQNLSGLHAVVIGRSRLVGQPLASLLLQENCTVTTIHSKTKNPQQLAAQADILCVAVGQPNLVTAAWVKTGAIVIDVGINRTQNALLGGLVGDVDFADVAPKTSAITPVPRGVGPMTIACLLRNTLYAAASQHGLSLPEDK